MVFVKEEFLHKKIEKKICFPGFDHKLPEDGGMWCETVWKLVKSIR